MTHTSFPLVLVAGATASGKSAFAVDLAQREKGVIINADSLQIYDALPVLTAQPTQAQKNAAPHALYATLSPDARGSVKDWLGFAVPAIRSTWAEGKLPIITGGTGLYLKTLLTGLSPIPDIPDDVRAETRALHKKIGNPDFHDELRKIDPVMAARLRPSDSQRLMRAYEVKMATGESLADWQEKPAVPPLPDASISKILIDVPREMLRNRAMTRLHGMIVQGVLDEVQAFAARIRSGEFSSDCAPTQALGYDAFVRHIDGAENLDTALQGAHIQTCQYIKRQQTWLRHQMTFDRVVSAE